MYHEKFPAHQVQPRAPRPPQEAYKSGAAFDGTTTSGSAYTAHPIPPRTVSPLTHQPLEVGATALLRLGNYTLTDGRHASSMEHSQASYHRCS